MSNEHIKEIIVAMINNGLMNANSFDEALERIVKTIKTINKPL